MRGRPLKYKLVGQTFDRLTVVALGPSRPEGARWLCECKCGNSIEARGSALVTGRIRSCGCLTDEARRSRATHKATVGATKSSEKVPLYNLWRGIIDRCTNKNSEAYPLYGGRGIRISPLWRNDFLAFVRDVGQRPSKAYTLDRFPNNDGNYEPGNVRWATRKQQCRNKRNNLIVIFRGRSMTLAEAAELTGIRYKLAHSRIGYGWPIEEALTPGRLPRSRSRGVPPATVTALGRACQAAGITLDDIAELVRRRDQEAA